MQMLEKGGLMSLGGRKIKGGDECHQDASFMYTQGMH